MNLRHAAAAFQWRCNVCLLGMLLFVGCASPSIQWDERVGVYTWDDALMELGEPILVTDLEGGVRSAEWVTERSIGSSNQTDVPAYLRGETTRTDELRGLSAPPRVLRLSFTPDGKLLDWSRNY